MATNMSKFSRKQAGVIYRAMKEGRIEISRESVSEMYDLVNDGDCIDWNGSANSAIQDLRLAVDAIFESDYEKAQQFIDRFAA